MANINILIPDDLHKKLKLQSIHSGMTLKDYIIKTLEAYEHEQKNKRK